MKRRVFILFIVLFPLALHPQDRSIRNLVFEGAGIRGIAYCGAIGALENKGVVHSIEKVGGTSAGAITALCVSLGYTASEITVILHSTNFKKFNDGRFFFAGGIHRMKKHFGWYRGEKFSRWLEKIIEKKTGDGNISFAQLREKGFKELYITATMLNEQKLVVLSHATYPNMRVKDAVRISISIPLYFEAIFMDKEGKIYPSPKYKKGLSVMVDGGFIGNFPIRIFDSVRLDNVDHPVFVNNETIGFRIDSDEQIKNDRNGKGLAEMPVNNLREYAAAFYNMIIENLNRQTLSADDWKRTISISDGNIGPRIRKLSRAEIDILIRNGKVATEQFLSNK
jgi:NTE family protein